MRQFSRHKTINTLLVYRDRTCTVQGQLASLVADTVTTAVDDGGAGIGMAPTAGAPLRLLLAPEPGPATAR